MRTPLLLLAALSGCAPATAPLPIMDRSAIRREAEARVDAELAARPPGPVPLGRRFGVPGQATANARAAREERVRVEEARLAADLARGRAAGADLR